MVRFFLKKVANLERCTKFESQIIITGIRPGSMNTTLNYFNYGGIYNLGWVNATSTFSVPPQIGCQQDMLTNCTFNEYDFQGGPEIDLYVFFTILINFPEFGPDI